MPKQNKGIRPFVAAFLAAGVATAVYSLIFPFYRWQHYVIAAGVALLVGRIGFIMAQGLDTTKEAPAQKPIPKTGDSAVDALVEKGQEMLKQIRNENDLIPDPELSAQMDQLDDVANRIFRTVADQPAKAPQIRRFMDYYLPTTLKMLTGYRKMDERQVSGQNAQQTRAQIRQAMDVVLRAFDKQLDALYQDEMLDISTDIDVMETMLKQDGLVDSGWDAQKIRQVQDAYQAQQEQKINGQGQAKAQAAPAAQPGQAQGAKAGQAGQAQARQQRPFG